MTKGQNLDVANSILQAEQLVKRSSPKKPAKSGKRSSKRRSASIERIFDKKKPEDMSPQVKQLQAQLTVLKQREHQLLMPRAEPAGLGAPGLPPPPPPPLPPPPSLPGTRTAILPKQKADSSTLLLPPALKPWLGAIGPTLAISVSSADLQGMLRNLRKVRPAVPPSPPPPAQPAVPAEPVQPPEPPQSQLAEQPEANEHTPVQPEPEESPLMESLSLAEALASRRELLAPESSDESVEQSESTEF